MTDYIVKVGNFNQSYSESALNTELYFDIRNCSYDDLKANKDVINQSRRNCWGLQNDKGQYSYDFSIIPSFGFLGDSLPLVKNVELKLSFDRAVGNIGVLKWSDEAGIKSIDKPIEISNCHAVTELVSSPSMRSFFEDIEMNPIVYKFEEAEVIVRTLEKQVETLRIDAVKGGNLPSYIFAGIIPQTSLTGTLESCSTEFTQHGVTRFNFTIDGQSVNGYPIEVTHPSRVYPLVKFLDTTSGLLNVDAGKTLGVETFKHNYLWSHKFEVENSSSGWIGIDFKLEKPFTDTMNIVIWLISPCAISIDKHNEVELIR